MLFELAELKVGKFRENFILDSAKFTQSSPDPENPENILIFNDDRTVVVSMVLRVFETVVVNLPCKITMSPLRDKWVVIARCEGDRGHVEISAKSCSKNVSNPIIRLSTDKLEVVYKFKGEKTTDVFYLPDLISPIAINTLRAHPELVGRYLLKLKLMLPLIPSLNVFLDVFEDMDQVYIKVNKGGEIKIP